VPAFVSPADYVIDVLLDPDRAQLAVADVSQLNFAEAWDKVCISRSFSSFRSFSSLRTQKIKKKKKGC
jgi:hypothetical protein